MPSLIEAEKAIKTAAEEKSAAARKMTSAKEAFEKSTADPTDPETPEFTAFDEAGKEYAEATQKHQNATRIYATLKGGQLDRSPGSGSGDDDPVDKQRGDNMLDQAVESLKAASVGRRVFASDGYKSLVEKGILTGRAEFGSVELGKAYSRDEIKALVGLGATASGASNLLTPDRQALVNLVPQRPLQLVNLVSKGTTDSKSIEYPVVASRGMQAGYVADPTTAAPIGSGDPAVTPLQAGRKPETNVVFDIRTASVKTLATWIPVHRNMMDDAPFLQSMIDAFLRDELDQRIESDIATGSGSGESLRGILNTSGIGSVAIGSGSVIDAAHKTLTAIRLQYEEATAFAIHPTTWETIRLLREDSGSGPGTGQYLFGPPSQAGDSTLWGKPVVVSPAITAGTVLAGDFSKAILWLRSGVRVLASDSHEDYFTRNLVALLAEMRAAFGVIKPLAFAKAS
jgi:HK97 family phage major capsid protein